MKHEWQYVPFSTHHGWESAQYVCLRCGKKSSGDNITKEGCLGDVKDLRAILRSTIDEDEKIRGILAWKEKNV